MLERYQIKQKISQKAGRSTYVADDSETNKQIVIKILEFNDLFSWDDFKLFEREAKILQNLSHPNIPNYLDYFEISESNRQGFALVQTYINAPSLAELIDRGIKFSETEIIELAEKLLNILEYLHGLNPPVIHRDIKPSNILLSNRSGNSIGDVYLVDFGSGQTVAKKEAGSITIVGSYGYIPLEQFMGKTTFASDLYSLGMTLIYLVTGIHPGELTQVKGKVQFNNKEISRNFSLWLEKITDSYVENRYQSANIALTALHSEDNSNGNFIYLKPQNSQINLYRDRYELIITYPSKPSIEINPFAGWIFFIFIFLCLTFSSANLDFLIIILIPIFIALMISIPQDIFRVAQQFYTLFKITKNDNGNLYVEKGNYFQKVNSPNLIDLLSIQTNDNRLGNFENIPVKINWDYLYQNEQIDHIIYSPGYSFDKCLDKKGKIVEGGTIRVPAKVSIIGTLQEHIIENIKFSKLSDGEFWWIGQEISDFLDLELEVISQTPVVPPKPTH